MGQVNDLVVRNAENLRWAIVQGIEDTVRKATTHLEGRLDQAINAIKRVIEDALARRNDRTVEVSSEIERLERVASDLQAIREAILEGSGDRAQPDIQSPMRSDEVDAS